MKFLSTIKKWPIEKKRIFSISVAIFLTILIIILNSALNLIWKEEVPRNKLLDKNSPINTMQESFSRIFEEAKPALEQIFGTSSDNIGEQGAEIVDQINTATTSFSTTSNIVE